MRTSMQPPRAHPLPSTPPRRSRAAAHNALGIQVGALGNEVLEAVELAYSSRRHEGRAAFLWRRGGGATRGGAAVGRVGQRGGGAARPRGSVAQPP